MYYLQIISSLIQLTPLFVTYSKCVLIRLRIMQKYPTTNVIKPCRDLRDHNQISSKSSCFQCTEGQYCNSFFTVKSEDPVINFVALPCILSKCFECMYLAVEKSDHWYTTALWFCLDSVEACCSSSADSCFDPLRDIPHKYVLGHICSLKSAWKDHGKYMECESIMGFASKPPLGSSGKAPVGARGQRPLKLRTMSYFTTCFRVWNVYFTAFW